MSEPAKKGGGWTKAMLIGLLGVGGGAAGTYATAVVDRVVKPTKPVANFAATADGLTLTCQNHASGESGWWDFGDGTALEPFKADGQAVTHTYAKPGTFTVKLTVRNYFSDENERSVPVEIGAAKESPVPVVNGFAVLPVSGSSVAPATFRLTAEVKNAEHCVWDFGDGRLDVDGGGKIDRMVTFDKPGPFAVQLVAHNGKQAVKQTAAVRVDAPADGTLMAVLKVTDGGTRVDRLTLTETVAIPVPSDKKVGFSKVVAARPGYTISQATPPASVPGAKNLKVEIAGDKRSATVSGEWADSKASNKSAGGSDVIVPLKMTEERSRPVPPTTTLVTGVFSANRAVLPLPPTPDGVTGTTRTFEVEIRATAGGRSATAAQGKGAVTLPWSGADARGTKYAAALDGDKVVVTAGR